MRILVIGPSPYKSKGGMATVISGIAEDKFLNSKFDIDTYDSYIDGNIVTRLVYSIYAFIKFLFIFKKYDLFHIHMASYGSTFRKAYYIRVLKKYHKKVIVHIHGAAYIKFFDGLDEKRKKYVIDTLKMSDMTIALSSEWKQVFTEKFRTDNITILNNGIDTEVYSAAATDVTRTASEFLFLGRIGERKGAYDLFKAVAQLKTKGINLRCYMAGDGDVEKMRKMVKDYKISDNIEVIGWVDFEKKIELLKKVSTVVLPSYNEGLPMAILEGMASGKAIISTDVGAIPEVVIDKINGIIIRPGDVDSLKKALELLSRDANMLESMSKCNISKIDNCFSRKRIHNILAEYYRKVMI